MVKKNCYKEVEIKFVDARVSTPSHTADDSNDRYPKRHVADVLSHHCYCLLWFNQILYTLIIHQWERERDDFTIECKGVLSVTNQYIEDFANNTKEC